MAEMTASEVKELFESQSFDGTISNQESEGIWSIIQQQAQTIEAQAKRLEAAEKVCRAVEAISSASEIYNPMLVDALKEWQGAK